MKYYYPKDCIIKKVCERLLERTNRKVNDNNIDMAMKLLKIYFYWMYKNIFKNIRWNVRGSVNGYINVTLEDVDVFNDVIKNNDYRLIDPKIPHKELKMNFMTGTLEKYNYLFIPDSQKMFKLKKELINSDLIYEFL